ncbi:hypothetical protein K523DRAFT_397088 [Schizophyllum commune Tattone D]|nr:hypothetical protein K523DRAFT_397088 [Schizophyllum commune Tattone D]
MVVLMIIACAICSPISVNIDATESIATSSTSFDASSPPALGEHITACCMSTTSPTSLWFKTHFDSSAALSGGVLNTRHDGLYRVGASKNTSNDGLAKSMLSVYTGFLIGVSAVALGASVGALLVTL